MALRELGIKPTPELIRNWVRAVEAEQELDAEEQISPVANDHAYVEEAADDQSSGSEPSGLRCDGLPSGTSQSSLVPMLREQGTLERNSELADYGNPGSLQAGCLKWPRQLQTALHCRMP